MNNDTIRQLVRESHLDVYGLGTAREKWEATVRRFVTLVEAELKKAEPAPHVIYHGDYKITCDSGGSMGIETTDGCELARVKAEK